MSHNVANTFQVNPSHPFAKIAFVNKVLFVISKAQCADWLTAHFKVKRLTEVKIIFFLDYFVSK
jgi:hypothetical protein